MGPLNTISHFETQHEPRNLVTSTITWFLQATQVNISGWCKRLQLSGESVVMALHVSYVQKFGFDVLESTFMTSQNTQ